MHNGKYSVKQRPVSQPKGTRKRLTMPGQHARNAAKLAALQGTRKRKETTQAWVDRVYGTKARAPEANRIDRFIDAIGVLVRAHIDIERANRDKAVSWLFFSLELESAEELMRALLTEASK